MPGVDYPLFRKVDAGHSARGSAASVLAAESLSFETARALGNVWTLTELWKELGFSELRRVFRRTRRAIDVEALIRIRVLNRLCDPESKLGVLRWVQTVALPEIEVTELTHQQLLRSMDALMDHQDAVDAVIASLLRPLGRPGRVGGVLRHDHGSRRRAHCPSRKDFNLSARDG